MCVANPCPPPLVAEVEAVVDVTTVAVTVDSTGDTHGRRSNADISSVDGTQHRVVVACRVVVIVLKKKFKLFLEEKENLPTFLRLSGFKSNYKKVVKLKVPVPGGGSNRRRWICSKFERNSIFRANAETPRNLPHFENRRNHCRRLN